eukprot:3941785-Rhodomonas_salina.1
MSNQLLTVRFVMSGSGIDAIELGWCYAMSGTEIGTVAAGEAYAGRGCPQLVRSPIRLRV